MLNNKTTYGFRDLVLQSGLSERNVRYYIYELKLLSEDRKKGSQRYSKSIRDKMVFIGMLRKETKKYRIRLSLDDIQKVLKDAANSIEAVADGREPLEIFDVVASDSDTVRKKIDAAKERGEEVMPITTSHIKDKVPTGSAEEYIRQHKNEFMSERSSHASENIKFAENQWQSVRLGSHVKLRVRGNYSQKTMNQLALLGPLVESILKEDKNNG